LRAEQVPFCRPAAQADCACLRRGKVDGRNRTEMYAAYRSGASVLQRAAAGAFAMSVGAVFAVTALAIRGGNRVQTDTERSPRVVGPPATQSVAQIQGKERKLDGAAAASSSGIVGNDGHHGECDCAPLWNCMTAGGDCAALETNLRSCMAASGAASPEKF
jgi:hypothetical protein